MVDPVTRPKEKTMPLSRRWWRPVDRGRRSQSSPPRLALIFSQILASEKPKEFLSNFYVERLILQSFSRQVSGPLSLCQRRCGTQMVLIQVSEYFNLPRIINHSYFDGLYSIYSYTVIHVYYYQLFGKSLGTVYYCFTDMNLTRQL